MNHLSPLSFHSQMRTSVAVLELSPCATRGHDRFDISFDFVVCLSNDLAAVGLLISISSIQIDSKKFLKQLVQAYSFFFKKYPVCPILNVQVASWGCLENV